MENNISPPLQVKKSNDLLNLNNAKISKSSTRSPMPNTYKKSSPSKKLHILSSPSY